MELLPLVIIPFIYLLVAFLKPYFQPKISFGICAICVAVSVTWFAMLVMWLIEMGVSPVSLGILMGMSITGIMYKMEKFYKDRNIRNFWLVRLVLIVGGFYFVFALLEMELNWLLLIAITSIVIVSVASLFFQKTKRTSDITKRLDNCC